MESQRARLLGLFCYVFILLLVARYLFASWLPPASERGLWFYAGLFSLLFGKLLLSPFFTRPVDAIGYAAPAILGLLAVNPSLLQTSSITGKVIWGMTTAFVALVFLAGTGSIIWKDSTNPTLRRLAQAFYVVCDSVGGPASIYSAMFIFAVVAFHREQRRELIVLTLLWVGLVFVRPIELMVNIADRMRRLWSTSKFPQSSGEVFAHKEPGFLIARKQSNEELNPGDLVALFSSSGKVDLALAVNNASLPDESWVELATLGITVDTNKLGGKAAELLPKEVVKIEFSALDAKAKAAVESLSIWSDRERLLGFVAENSDIRALKFKIVRTDVNLSEGQLVLTQLQGKPVLFQLTNGLTKEEALAAKNSRGYALGHATKLGRWNNEKQLFEYSPWIPDLNAPVFLVYAENPELSSESIGHFPGTNYDVRIDVNELVSRYRRK